MPRRRRIVVAFGGNALIRQGQVGTQWEQLENAQATARLLTPLVRAGHELVIVHGNGPQVGNILIQVEEAVTKVPPLSLDVCVAASEGSMGYMLDVALLNALTGIGRGAEVMTLVTEVIVDPEDPGFRRPTKPIGPFYPRFRAEFLIHKQGWNMIEDSGRGWRKVVPSPRPLEIMQMRAIRDSVGSGRIVVAGGGGGIPIYRGEDGRLRGVEAVIDKDYTARLIATEIGADLLVILTAVDSVYLNYGRPGQRPVRRLDIDEARVQLEAGQFPEGSMGPKIRAAIEFVEATGGEVLITSADSLTAALGGPGGTRVVRRRPPPRSRAGRRVAAAARRLHVPRGRRKRGGVGKR